MAKRIACLSTLKDEGSDQGYSEQVFSIFDSARLYNKENEIYGVFLVCGDVLLQVMEGASDKLANAIYRASRDPRVGDVSIIVNQAITKPVFSRWTIKLISERNAENAQYLETLRKLVEPLIKSCKDADRVRLAKIFHADSADEAASSTSDSAVQNTENTAPDFSGKVISMNSWPRPTDLRLTAPLMKLCPLLIGRKVSYDRLQAANIFENETLLYELLCQLHSVGSLIVNSRSNKASVSGIEDARNARGDSSQNSNRFSQALRNFIQSHKAKGVGSP